MTDDERDAIGRYLTDIAEKRPVSKKDQQTAFAVRAEARRLRALQEGRKQMSDVVPPPGHPLPTLGRIVIYESKVGDGIKSPALVLRTRATTDPAIIERWGPGPDGTLSGKGRPEGLVPELPDDHTVDLLVFGLGGDYREYAVPFGKGARTWDWPARV